jgi:hypothetical protein
MGYCLVERSELLVIRVFGNVKRATVKAQIYDHISQGTVLNTEKYTVHSKIERWGYTHKTVCHSGGDYTRDDDGGGINGVHINTQKEIWSVLRL